MGAIGCRESSARNYHFAPRNILEKRSSHVHLGGRLESRIAIAVDTGTIHRFALYMPHILSEFV